jgi:hypothetical protein
MGTTNRDGAPRLGFTVGEKENQDREKNRRGLAEGMRY